MDCRGGTCVVPQNDLDQLSTEDVQLLLLAKHYNKQWDLVQRHIPTQSKERIRQRYGLLIQAAYDRHNKSNRYSPYHVSRARKSTSSSTTGGAGSTQLKQLTKAVQRPIPRLPEALLDSPVQKVGTPPPTTTTTTPLSTAVHTADKLPSEEHAKLQCVEPAIDVDGGDSSHTQAQEDK